MQMAAAAHSQCSNYCHHLQVIWRDCWSSPAATALDVTHVSAWRLCKLSCAFPSGALCSRTQLQSSELQACRCAGLHVAASAAASAAFGPCLSPAGPYTSHNDLCTASEPRCPLADADARTAWLLQSPQQSVADAAADQAAACCRPRAGAGRTAPGRRPGRQWHAAGK